MSTEPIPHELLLRHAGFLRRIARDLVGDPSAADDAVQEVWLRALERPPAHAANVRGWLRTVLTNLVRSQARGASRREARERERALDADPEAPAAHADDEALLRQVTEAVLALEEPLRATVLQHYFQGRTVVEIAERDRLPVSTVKSRLRRALELLRARMKHASGDAWRSSLLALTVPVEVLCRAPLTRAGEGVLLMSLKTKLVIGCAALLALALAYRGWKGGEGAPPDAPAGSGPVVSAASADGSPPAGTALAADAKPAERAPLETRSEAPAAPRNPRPQTLFYGSLLDPAGQPLVGLWSEGVSLTDADGRRRHADAKESGTFAFHALPFGTYWVSAGADGYQSTTDVLVLDPACPQVQKDLTLAPAPILRVRVVTPEGQNLFEALQGERKSAGHAVLVPVATRERPGPWFKEVVGSLNNPFGVGHFWQYGPRAEALPKGYMGILVLDQELPVHVSLVNYHRVLQTLEVQPGETEVRFVVSPDDLEASFATLSMRVVDAEGRAPIPSARAMLWGGTYMDGGQAADANGNIVFEGREPGEFDLHVLAKGYEEYVAHVLADSGVTTDLGEIALERELRVQVKVVDGSGAPRSERFNLGVHDPVTRTLRMERQQVYQASGDGLLELSRLGRRRYVIRSANHDAVNDEGRDETKWVSGNVLLDLRSGAAPANVVIQLVPATRLRLLVKGRSADGLRFRVTDEQGLELVKSRFYGDGPRPLTLPRGTYAVALLDEAEAVLEERSVTLGAEPRTLEFSR